MNVSIPELLDYLGRFALAFALALPVALERERSTRIMGLRTFPLVALASCGYVLVAVSVLGGDSPDHSRIIQGLMTGIGFIGGGAILKEGASVRGTATAASIWTMGVLGAAIGYGEIEIAVLLAVINFLILRVLTPIEKRLGKEDRADRQAPGEPD